MEGTVVPREIPKKDLQTITKHGRARIISPDRIDEEYLHLIEYLCEQWELESEQDLLTYMSERGIRFWSPLPGEDVTMYKYFSYFIQIPSEYRTFTNTARYIIAYERGISLEELLSTPGAELGATTVIKRITQEQLFWQTRANLFEKSMTMDLMLSVEHSQKEKIAAMQQRNLSFAALTNDLSLQMLTLVAQKLHSLSAEELRLTDISQWVKAAGMITRDGQAIMESSMALGDILAMIEENERLENATIIDGS